MTPYLTYLGRILIFFLWSITPQTPELKKVSSALTHWEHWEKNHICFENTLRRSPTIHIWCRIYEPCQLGSWFFWSTLQWSCWLDHFFFQLWLLAAKISDGTFPILCTVSLSLVTPPNTFLDLVTLTFDLWTWPLNLTFELDLDILPLDPHAEFQVRLFVHPGEW